MAQPGDDTADGAVGTGHCIGLGDGPSLTMDGLGNAVATWTRGSVIQAAAFDASPPAFTGVNVPATGTTGQPVAASATTLDTWSALGGGQPSWNFGDGKSPPGRRSPTSMPRPGRTPDGERERRGRQRIATDDTADRDHERPGAASASHPADKRREAEAEGRLEGEPPRRNAHPVGHDGREHDIDHLVRKHGGKKTAFKSTFKAKSGKWTRTLKLPASLAPGRYDVTVTGNGVRSSQTSFTLAAPRSGIVRRAYATGPRRGPAATTLGSTSELWAHFMFGTLPARSQKITTQWTLPNGRKLGANARPRTSLVEAQVKDLSGSPCRRASGTASSEQAARSWRRSASASTSAWLTRVSPTAATSSCRCSSSLAALASTRPRRSRRRGTTLTYAQLAERVDALGRALRGDGIVPGDRVAALAPNRSELLEAHFGVPASGAALCAINTRLGPRDRTDPGPLRAKWCCGSRAQAPPRSRL